MFKIEDIKRISLALQFAKERHAGQVRRASGDEYISHPIVVSYIATYFKKSKNIGTLICAAILHDVVEDTKTSYGEILDLFGMKVASIVFELTSDPEEIARVGKFEYLKTKMLGMSSYALFLKLCDRLGNIIDHPSEKQMNDTVLLIKELKQHRKLSRSQKNVIAAIEETLAGKAHV